MTGFLLLGLLSLATGIMFLIAPRALIRLGECFNRVLALDSKTFRYRIFTGSFLVAAAIFFFAMAYYFSRVSWS